MQDAIETMSPAGEVSSGDYFMLRYERRVFNGYYDMSPTDDSSYGDHLMLRDL